MYVEAFHLCCFLVNAPVMLTESENARLDSVLDEDDIFGNIIDAYD